MDSAATRASLGKKLEAATAAWERLPILLQLAELTIYADSPFSHRCAQEALDLAQEMDDRFWIACSMKALGDLTVLTFRHSEALDYLQSASDIFRELSDPRMTAKTDTEIAQTYIAMGELDKALALLSENLRVFTTLEDRVWAANTYALMGSVYRNAGEHSKALRYCRHAMNMALKAEIGNIGPFYQDIALVYVMMEDMERGKAYFLKSLKAYRDSNNRTGVMIAAGNIASLHNDQHVAHNDPRFLLEGRNYVLLSLKLARELDYPILEAHAWGKLMSIYGVERNPAKAAFCFRRALALARKSDQEGNIIRGKLYEGFAVVCRREGKHEKGVRYLRKALDIIAGAGQQPYYVWQIHQTLAQSYEEAGNSAKALEHHKEYIRIKDDYMNQQKAMEVAKAEMQRKIRLLGKELKKNQSDNSLLREVIEQKEAELLSLTLALPHVQEGKQRKYFGRKERGGTYHAVETNISVGSSPMGSWEIFAQQFQKVHYTFYTRLIRTYPALTATEIRVCSLIRTGLSSNKIADMLGISRKTVDKHRSNIHKKMDLSSGSSLADFIVGM